MRICDLRQKEVINIKDCKRLGYVCDIEFDRKTGCITQLIVPGTGKICVAADGLADGDSVVLTLPEDADKSAEYVLEFTTESGDTQSFDTLSYEVAPISLLSVDAAAGATPISFGD